MSNEKIKAPVVFGFEPCSQEDWLNIPIIGNRLYLRAQSETFYYTRIKPKEKSIKEIVDEEFGFHFLQDTKDKFKKCFERILENYVKKEG